MPVKDSLETAREALLCLYASEQKDWQFCLYNDFSTPENTATLRQWATEFGFQIINWEEHTSHPSPNYLLTLQDAQQKALADGADLVIVESDVLMRPDTLKKLLNGRAEGVGMVASVTHDEDGNVNFPYLFAKGWKAEPTETKKRFSFCCTLLTNAFLNAFPFSELNPEKNWFDVTISHKSVEIGFKNILLMDAPVLHKPHSSRPWKQLKYTNPIKYYLLKLIHHKDKI